MDETIQHGTTSAIVVEIYVVHWLKDVAVGTVRVLVNNVVPAQPMRPFRHPHDIGMQFVALQVRRPSGRPQGIPNIGVSILNSLMRSMPLYQQPSSSAVGMHNILDKKHPKQKHKQKAGDLPRSKSDSSSMVIGGSKGKIMKRNVSIREKATSLINASDVSSSYQLLRKKSVSSKVSIRVNRSDIGKKGGKAKRKGNNPLITDSELRPSPSEVIADLAKKEQQRPNPNVESSIITWSVNAESVEGLQSKLERWKVPAIYD